MKCYSVVLLFASTALISCGGKGSETGNRSDTAGSAVRVSAGTVQSAAADSEMSEARRIRLTDVRENDGYWRRGVVYETNRPGEQLAHVRVAVHDSFVRFYCIGLDTFPRPDDTTRARLYEITPGAPPAVIDTFDFPAYSSRWVSAGGGKAATELVLLRHYDNLRVCGDKLLYYIENSNRYRDSAADTALRYMAYTTGSGQPAREIDDRAFSDGHRHIQINELEHAVHSPDMQLCAYTGVYDIGIYHDVAMGDAIRDKEPFSWPPLDRDRGISLSPPCSPTWSAGQLSTTTTCWWVG